MSSPLSLLRKNRRAPLLGSLDAGRKRVPFKQSSTVENELASLNDDFSRRCRQNLPNPDGASSKPKMSPKGKATDCSPPSDFELMSIMMQKLVQLEIKVKAQALDNHRKEKTIAALEEKLKLQKKPKEKRCEEELVRMCHKLQNQVWEMEQFLSDYGLIWVGSNDGGHADGACTGADGACIGADGACTGADGACTGADGACTGADGADLCSRHSLWEPETSQVREFQMNFDLVLENLQELNVLAGEGESYVKAVPGGAQLARHSPIPLQLYSNGLVMFNGPFRSYDDPSTQQCMRDLMDGYFPSELQQRFPDGVPFQVQDRRAEEYRDRRARGGFPGKGQLVCAASTEASPHSPATSAQRQSYTPGKAASTEHFLRKLPKTVIKAGKVINVRDSIRNHLKGSAGEAHERSETIIATPALQTLQQRLDQPERKPSDHDDEDISTLRVKSEDGEKTFILKMRVTQTIGDLRHYLDQYRCSGSSAYIIISVFPRRRYDDDTQTLADCGLTPTAALLLQSC